MQPPAIHARRSDVVHRHVGSFGGEAVGDGAADTVSRARHDYHLQTRTRRQGIIDLDIVD